MDEVEPDGRWYAVLFGGALILSLGIAFFHEGGYGDVAEKEREIAQLEEEIGELESEYDRIKQYRLRLENDPHLIESLARERLGFTRPGEKKLEFPDRPPFVRDEGEPDGALPFFSGSESEP